MQRRRSRRPLTPIRGSPRRLLLLPAERWYSRRQSTWVRSRPRCRVRPSSFRKISKPAHHMGSPMKTATSKPSDSADNVKWGYAIAGAIALGIAAVIQVAFGGLDEETLATLPAIVA